MKSKTQTIAIDEKQIPENFVQITTFKFSPHFKALEKAVAKKQIDVIKYFKDGRALQKATAVYVDKDQAAEIVIDEAIPTPTMSPEKVSSDADQLLKNILVELKKISARLPKEQTPTSLFK